MAVRPAIRIGLLTARIAAMVMGEDRFARKRKFWESRFRAVVILGERGVLACAAYVDLSPIGVALAGLLAWTVWQLSLGKRGSTSGAGTSDS